MTHSDLSGTDLSDSVTTFTEETSDPVSDLVASPLPGPIDLGSPDGIFDIIGTPIAGEPLQFRIRNYDPEIIYEMNLGNGERQRVFKESFYRYPEPGSFKITLTFTKPGDVSLYVSRYLKVRPVDSQSATLVTPTYQPAVAEARNLLPDTQTAVIPKLPEVVTETEKPVQTPEKKIATPTPPVSVSPPTNPATPVEFAEKMPAFPGGPKALNDYFSQKIIYPEMARENEIEGKVYVRFTVLPDGKTSDFSIVRGIGYGCDEEALRVVYAMPKWIPGEQNGQKIPVIKTLPITFRLK
ncbi:MAG: TonB family protein [Bacteroidia bacterium]|nr:TonB family protein [Bacteroidia bacterium]